MQLLSRTLMQLLFLALVTLLGITSVCSVHGFQQFSFCEEELRHYRDETEQLFRHAYNHYVELAYPFDEVYPIKCRARTRNFEDPLDHPTNDVLGNFSATLIDSLTTLAVLGDVSAFRSAVRLVERDLQPDFSIDATVQVFETTIRILGGLLSAHLYATDPTKKVYLGSDYDGFLLQRAQRLADRLLPAYSTRTGIPLPRINLAHGLRHVPATLQQENNAAAMACPMLEFTMLSYLTHDDKYRNIARYAFDVVWSLKSKLDLLPMSFSPHDGTPFNKFTGTGASIDSFYEYALKGAILFDDEELWDTWEGSYYALRKHSRNDWFYANIDVDSGQVITPWIDSLSAFFPGLQVLAGDLEDAKMKHLMFLKLWNTYGALPERWEFQPQDLTGESPQELSCVPLPWYPLRPEFIESTYFLYRATKDVFYLKVAWTILEDLKALYKTPCGFAGLQNVVSGERQDRMETFVLSETLKYLYLIFDTHNELHSDSSNTVFSTEAHPLWLRASDLAAYKSCRGFNNSHNDTVPVLSGEDPKESFFVRLLGAFMLSAFPKAQKGLRLLPLNQLSAKNGGQLKPQSSARMCAISPSSSAAFLHSSMLSEFSRLFEIEHRYSETLLRPRRLFHRTQMELNPKFYETWSGWDQAKLHDGMCMCLAAPTTESYEMLFSEALSDLEAPDARSARQVPLGNGTVMHRIELAVLAGVRLRIEVLLPGALDIYGRKIEQSLFESISRENVLDKNMFDVSDTNAAEDQDSSATSMGPLYRATAVDGMMLPFDGVVHLLKLSALNSESVSGGLLGYNRENMLLIGGVPVINLLVDEA
ncbi:LAQU0S22e00276g1_1 [Lachancea quebecensis]|uniref:alpha-1,2-Mannosidase n=1 Tax=Lachancea quebecensis TaxID=1654605 RepID=A0A0P1KX97_9SACH|nr:LAQU0S22e00276g1_1 [Lachancea quebecensis]